MHHWPLTLALSVIALGGLYLAPQLDGAASGDERFVPTPVIAKATPELDLDPACEEDARFAEMFAVTTLPSGAACPGFTTAVRRVIEPRLSDLRACVSNDADRQALPERFDIQVWVRADGGVASSVFPTSALGESAWGRCLSDVIQTWSFDVPLHSSGLQFKLPMRR